MTDLPAAVPLDGQESTQLATESKPKPASPSGDLAEPPHKRSRSETSPSGASAPPPEQGILATRRQSNPSSTRSFSLSGTALPSPQPPTTALLPPSFPRPKPLSKALSGATMVSVVEAAEAESSGKRPQSNTVPVSHKLPDPVDLHMLSLAEAESLFRQFFQHMNPLIKLFDRHLHTVQWVREHSSVLFSTLLAVSARHFRPELYQSLQSQATTLVARGVFGSAFEIGLLQSLMLLVYWKEPGDATAFLRVGIIIRLAYQLRLHTPRTTRLPAGELDARMTLDRERTWLNAICFDSSYSYNFDEIVDAKNSSLQDWSDLHLDDWLNEGLLYDCPEDSLLVASIETTKVSQACRIIEASRSAAGADMLVRRNRLRLESAWQKYLKPEVPCHCSRDTPGLNKSRLIYLVAATNISRARLIAHEMRLDMIIDDYLPAVAALFAFAIELINQDQLVFLQDFFALVFFRLAEFLARVFQLVPQGYQRNILQWLSDFCTCCTNARKGREDVPPAYLARYYRLVLRSITSQEQIRSRATSVQPSTAATTAPPTADTTAAPDVTAANQPLDSLDDFLPIPDVLDFADPRQDFEALMGLSNSNDFQYWESVLPGFHGESGDSLNWLAPTL
ncbi:hypothetical protein OIV83_004949 [Microbotryomycetes sp. JL201]|nr:hypothetical protein OIV83_004949 [Microbotryomycetes sp. JL201]